MTTNQQSDWREEFIKKCDRGELSNSAELFVRVDKKSVINFISSTIAESIQSEVEKIEQVVKASYMSMLDQKRMEYKAELVDIYDKAVKERERSILATIEFLKSKHFFSQEEKGACSTIINLITSPTRATMGEE